MEKKKHALRQLLAAVEKELLKKPNRKTLDRLSLLAGFQDWDSFQEALHGEADGKVNYSLEENKETITFCLSFELRHKVQDKSVINIKGPQRSHICI